MGLKPKKKHSNNFPIGESVTKCFLKKVEYKSGEREDGDHWEGIIFSIINGDEWVGLFVADANPLKYPDDNQLARKKYQIELAIERMLSLYLTKTEMVAFRNGLVNVERHFRAFCEYAIETLSDKNYKDISIDVKTSPNRGGGATILPIGVFAKKSTDMEKVLQYTDWENDRIENFHKY